MSYRDQYWVDCAKEGLYEAGIEATDEQITTLAKHFEGAHESFGYAFYQPENPLIGELKEAKKKLQIEEAKVFCEPCKGTGRIYTQGPYHGSDSKCWKCHGYGKHNP